MTRPARLLTFSEAPIPSAVLGVHAVLEDLARSTGALDLRTGSSITPLAADVAWADAIILVRGASPAEARILAEAQRLGRRVATYLDDDLERVPESARSAYFFRAELVRRSIADIVTGADLVLVTSERLGRELAARHARATILLRQPRPAPLPAEVGAPPQESRDERIRIGFLGSVDHADFLRDLILPALHGVKEALGPRVHFVFCGAVPEGAQALAAEAHPFEPDFAAWRRRARALRLDIGLAPLPDTEFHRCKYWNKYLEYASLGVAGIYSDVPPSADVVVHGETGLLCGNEASAWREAILKLALDPSLRTRIAAAAASDAERRFSPQALRDDWSAALAPLLAHRAPRIGANQVRIGGGALRYALDRLALYGPMRFAERALGRLTGRLRPG